MGWAGVCPDLLLLIKLPRITQETVRLEANIWPGSIGPDHSLVSSTAPIPRPGQCQARPARLPQSSPGLGTGSTVRKVGAPQTPSLHRHQDQQDPCSPTMGVLPDTVRSGCFCLILSGNAVHPRPGHRGSRTPGPTGLSLDTRQKLESCGLPYTAAWGPRTLPPLLPYSGFVNHRGTGVTKGSMR